MILSSLRHVIALAQVEIKNAVPDRADFINCFEEEAQKMNANPSYGRSPVRKPRPVTFIETQSSDGRRHVQMVFGSVTREQEPEE